MSYRVVLATTDATRRIRSLRSWSFAENAGTPAAARVLLRNGSSSGDVVVDVRLAASESKHVSYAAPVFFPAGLYVQVSVGTVRGSVEGV